MYNNPIRPFRFWCQKVLPLVYDDSLSYYELLCKVVDYLNNLIEDVNSLSNYYDELKAMVEELQSYVENYFDNLDLQEEVNNKLDEMAEDGTLETLISNAIFGRSLAFERIFRDYNATGRFLNTSSLGSMCAFSQGGCKTPNGYIIGYINGYSISSYNTVLLKEYNMNGEILRTASIDLGHCNDITYHDGKLYVCRDFMLNSGNHVDYQYVDCYDYSNLAFIESISVPFVPVSVFFKDDILHAMSRQKTIYKLENGAWSTLYTLQGGGYQTVEYFEGFVYMITNGPNKISKFNYSTGKLVDICEIKRSYGIFYMGEPQQLSFDEDGNMYMHSSVHIPYNVYEYTFVWKTNIYTNWYSNDKANILEEGVRNYYISYSNTNKNPDGSESNPFVMPSEACMTALLTKGNTINFSGTGHDYEDCIYLSGINVSVEGRSNRVSFIRISRANCVLDHVDTFGAESGVDSNVNIGDSTVYIRSGAFSNENGLTPTAYIVNNFSIVNYQGCVFNGDITPVYWNSSAPFIRNPINRLLALIDESDSYWTSCLLVEAGNSNVNTEVEYYGTEGDNLAENNNVPVITITMTVGNSLYSVTVPVSSSDIRSLVLGESGYEFTTPIRYNSTDYDIQHKLTSTGYTLVDNDGLTSLVVKSIYFH